MELVATIEEPVTISRILAHLGLPARAPPRGRPWQRQRPLPLRVEHPNEPDVDPPSRFE